MFLGNEADAIRVAQLDGNHYHITSFDKHTGDPFLRSSMRFLVTFADKEQIWKNWSTELFATVQYEDYIRQHRPLYPLSSILHPHRGYLHRRINLHPTCGTGPKFRPESSATNCL